MKKLIFIFVVSFLVIWNCSGQQTFVTDKGDTVVITPRSITTNDVIIKPYKQPNPTKAFYIAANGNDANNGTISAPWKTLTKLNSSFSSLPLGANVLLNRGDVFYGSIAINKSGVSGSPITIGAYGIGVKPVITGFSTVSNWTANGGGIYTSTAAVTTATTLNMVTFQGTMQPMGRWPKLNSNSNGGYLEFQSHSNDASITSNAISAALNYVGGEVVQRKASWILDRGRISAQTSTTVSYNTLIGDNHSVSIWTYYKPVDGHGFFFQNHVNACTVLGEWAYDSLNKKIKMYFGGGSPASYTIKVANLENLISMTSKNFITLDNIEFRGSNKRTIEIITSNNIKITNCDINYSGSEGIYVSSAASNNITVSNSTISYTNNNAINGNGSTNWNILSNTLNKTATVRGAGQSDDGQYVGMSDIGANSLIQYNVLKNTGYIGINFEGNSITVKNNLVDTFCLVKNDGGGIYTYGGGEVITGTRQVIDNIILHGIGDRFGLEPVFRQDPYSGDVTGIYYDGGASDIITTGNTVAWSDYNGFQFAGNKMTITNNTAFDNKSIQFELKYGHLTTNLNMQNNIGFAKNIKSIVLGVNSPVTNPGTWGILNNNYYCRPIYEPSNIDATGSYIGRDFGGIIEANLGTGYRMKSLDKWQVASGQDGQTKKSPKTITDTGDIRFEYNATALDKVIPLPFNYIDVRGTVYTTSITIPAYGSAVLIKQSL